ncbi:MAG: peptide chain release factor N(5)-glutamine methyltransferase [Anaerolineales bacterium]
MTTLTTADQVLQDARGELASASETPALDARLLLAEVLGCEPDWLLAHAETELNERQVQDFSQLLRRRRQGEALPHILGWWEFYGRRFQVDRSVLIPRPETELLIEEALKCVDRHPEAENAIDIGTGSGCIAVTLAIERPRLHLVATDISARALKVAYRNAQAHGVLERMDLVQADLLPPLKAAIHLVCANLPYVSSGELEKLAVGRQEPNVALDGGKDGLRLVRRMLDALPGFLEPEGSALIEIGADQGREVIKAVQSALPLAQVRVKVDPAGRDRLVVIQR